MHKYNLISILVPIISVILIASAFLFLKPTTTGLVVYSTDEEKSVNADVKLKTSEEEIIPPQAIVEVQIDDHKSIMTIKDFIESTGKDFEMRSMDMPQLKYTGPGYTGDHEYVLTLADFDLNRKIGKGEHIFRTRILYQGAILYEKENRIMISE